LIFFIVAPTGLVVIARSTPSLLLFNNWLTNSG